MSEAVPLKVAQKQPEWNKWLAKRGTKKNMGIGVLANSISSEEIYGLQINGKFYVTKLYLPIREKSAYKSFCIPRHFNIIRKMKSSFMIHDFSYEKIIG